MCAIQIKKQQFINTKTTVKTGYKTQYLQPDGIDLSNGI